MVQKIKKHKKSFLVFVIGLLFIIAGALTLSGIINLPEFASAQETETVSVTATVQPYIVFTAQPSSVTLTPDLVSTAGTANIASSSNVSLLIGTNSGGGWIVSVQGLYGAIASSSASATPTILSVALGATTTLVAGIDGYGINATNVITGVSILGNGYGGWGSPIVGAVASSSPQDLMSKATANSSTTVGYIKVYAAATTTKTSGTYTDTITLTATSQP